MKNRSEKDQRMAASMQNPHSFHHPRKVAARKARQFESRMNSLRKGGTYA